MGGIVSLSSLACCFTSSACSLGCAMCPNAGSKVSKIMYAIILLLTVVVSCCMLAPGLEGYLSKLPFCEKSKSLSSSVSDFIAGTGSLKINCNDVIGYLAVYRICFVVTLFFLLLSIIMLGVKSSKDWRSGIQNGFWGFKFLIILIGCVAAFFIPHGGFGTAWMYIGLFGGLLFILVQLVLIVDFAHLTVEHWQDNYNSERQSSNMYYAFLIATSVTYVAIFIAIVLCFVYYTGDGSSSCGIHKFFILFNACLCVILSISSILPIVQERLPHSGLMQASFVSLFIIYLTWSAMSNQPDGRCKPNYFRSNNSTFENVVDSEGKDEGGLRMVTILELVIWFSCILYSTIATASNSTAARLTMQDHVVLIEDTDGPSNSDDGSDESEGVTYNWSLFHLLFALATLSAMMTLTSWYSPTEHVIIQNFSSNMSAVWIKIVSSWACFAIYSWTLAAPVVFPDREF